MFWKKKKNTERNIKMSKNTRAQMYSDYLRTEGYAPEVDKDGDIIFKYEGHVYYILISEDDDIYFNLLFPNFWSIENDSERMKVEKASLHATADTKVAKVYPVRDNVWAKIELFCSPPESFKTVFPRSMSALQSAVQTFATKMRE
jgi:hypothetical protein